MVFGNQMLKELKDQCVTLKFRRAATLRYWATSQSISSSQATVKPAKNQKGVVAVDTRMHAQNIKAHNFKFRISINFLNCCVC